MIHMYTFFSLHSLKVIDFIELGRIESLIPGFPFEGRLAIIDEKNSKCCMAFHFAILFTIFAYVWLSLLFLLYKNLPLVISVISSCISAV